METNMQDKNIGVFGYSANKPEFREFVKGFATGISKYNKCFYEPERQYRECDIAVIFGSFREDKDKERTDYHRFKGEVLREDCRVVYIESALLNRVALVLTNTHWRVAADSFMMDGKFGFRDNPPSDRFDELNIKPKPWKTDGDYVLLGMQLLKDASLFGTDHKAWAEQTVTDILAKTDLPVKIRMHPLTKPQDENRMFAIREFEKNPRVSFSKRGTPLEEDFAGAKCMVSFTSGSGIDAVIAGVPHIAMDCRSMASPMSGWSLDHIDNPVTPDRTTYLRNMAYAQWTPEEMESGECWKHLLDNVFNNK